MTTRLCDNACICPCSLPRYGSRVGRAPSGEHKNWFWAKYLPDGSPDKNPKGMELAGRVAKGNEEAGCIACHSAEEDYIFTTNHIE